MVFDRRFNAASPRYPRSPSNPQLQNDGLRPPLQDYCVLLTRSFLMVLERLPGPVIPWYVYGMKTAISLPDDLFESADALAERLGLSRSELYATAVAEYLAKHRDEDVTGRLNGSLR